MARPPAPAGHLNRLASNSGTASPANSSKKVGGFSGGWSSESKNKASTPRTNGNGASKLAAARPKSNEFASLSEDESGSSDDDSDLEAGGLKETAGDLQKRLGKSKKALKEVESSQQDMSQASNGTAKTKAKAKSASNRSSSDEGSDHGLMSPPSSKRAKVNGKSPAQPNGSSPSSKPAQFKSDISDGSSDDSLSSSDSDGSAHAERNKNLNAATRDTKVNGTKRSASPERVGDSVANDDKSDESMNDGDDDDDVSDDSAVAAATNAHKAGARKTTPSPAAPKQTTSAPPRSKPPSSPSRSPSPSSDDESDRDSDKGHKQTKSAAKSTTEAKKAEPKKSEPKKTEYESAAGLKVTENKQGEKLITATPQNSKLMANVKPEPRSPPPMPSFDAPNFHLEKMDPSQDAEEIAEMLNTANLEGKQVWYLTAPMELPISVIQELDFPAGSMQNGTPVFNYEGGEYQLAMDDPAVTSSIKLLIPHHQGKEYRMSNRPLAHSVHVTRMETFTPVLTHYPEQAPPLATERHRRPQPTGLRQKLYPIGVKNVHFNPQVEVAAPRSVSPEQQQAPSSQASNTSSAPPSAQPEREQSPKKRKRQAESTKSGDTPMPTTKKRKTDYEPTSVADTDEQTPFKEPQAAAAKRRVSSTPSNQSHASSGTASGSSRAGSSTDRSSTPRSAASSRSLASDLTPAHDTDMDASDAESLPPPPKTIKKAPSKKPSPSPSPEADNDESDVESAPPPPPIKTTKKAAPLQDQSDAESEAPPSKATKKAPRKKSSSSPESDAKQADHDQSDTESVAAPQPSKKTARKKASPSPESDDKQPPKKRGRPKLTDEERVAKEAERKVEAKKKREAAKAEKEKAKEAAKQRENEEHDEHEGDDDHPKPRTKSASPAEAAEHDGDDNATATEQEKPKPARKARALLTDEEKAARKAKRDEKKARQEAARQLELENENEQEHEHEQEIEVRGTQEKPVSFSQAETQSDDRIPESPAKPRKESSQQTPVPIPSRNGGD